MDDPKRRLIGFQVTFPDGSSRYLGIHITDVRDKFNREFKYDGAYGDRVRQHIKTGKSRAALADIISTPGGWGQLVRG